MLEIGFVVVVAMAAGSTGFIAGAIMSATRMLDLQTEIAELQDELKEARSQDFYADSVSRVPGLY